MAWHYSLQTGDELISAKSNDAFIKHHAVVVRYPNDPRVYVVDNDTETGVKMQLFNEYEKENNNNYGPVTYPWQYRVRAGKQ